MERIERAYYESRFEVAFLRAKGNAFQTLFNELMGKAYKEDFMPCRPWGSQGDQKNDGFLKSERRLFQVYAPNEMTENKGRGKITEDFEGAKSFWRAHFDKWTFVLNARDGIPPYVQKLMLELENSNPGIKLDPWGWEELLAVFNKLSRRDLESWFGYAPNAQAKSNMGFDDLRVVLEAIRTERVDSAAPVREVPARKIEANQLSDSIAILLKEGMTKAALLDDFFQMWHDPTFGERIAAAFRERYEELREDLTPNEIFLELQNWIGGSVRGTPEHEMAIFTVIAYYFESCDIYEEPRN